MVGNESELTEREQRLGKVVFACLRAIERGQPEGRAELLARHPELAADLTAFFADQENVRSWAAALLEVAHVGQAEQTIDHGDLPSQAERDGILPAGTRIGHLGDYEVLQVIGQGGNGVVYRARQ